LLAALGWLLGCWLVGSWLAADGLLAGSVVAGHWLVGWLAGWAGLASWAGWLPVWLGWAGLGWLAGWLSWLAGWLASKAETTDPLGGKMIGETTGLLGGKMIVPGALDNHTSWLVKTSSIVYQSMDIYRCSKGCLMVSYGHRQLHGICGYVSGSSSFAAW
jgi:ribosomal protein S27AE